nr:tRNA glutamyl-Q(34) synthetase GluQRS [Parvularcula maris]
MGHAYSALLNHDHARENGGAFRLRIEDIDAGRCRPEFEEAVLEDLAWLGIEPDGEVVRQSGRLPIYEKAIEHLRTSGLLYRCFRTRSELNEMLRAPHGAPPAGLSPGPHDEAEEARLLEEDRPFAWRLSVERAREIISRGTVTAFVDGEEAAVTFTGEQDPIIARKDFPASYHLACVIDDAHQGVDLVWRGEDLRASLPVQLLLHELLRLPIPSYRHHKLILGPDGKRLAKRDRAATLRSWRREGHAPEALRRRLGLGPPRC